MSLYSALLAAGLLMSAPWWIARMLTSGRYREGLGERLGRVPQRLRNAVRGRRVVWVHAVSVGEVLAAARLVQQLGEQLGEAWTIVLSTTTRTGQALARERFGADRVFYYPLDFRGAVRVYLRALRPELLVLMESELWPRLLHEVQLAGIPVAVVNARMSDRSFHRASRVRALWKRVFGGVTLWLAQSEEDAGRLLALGAPASAVEVSGNLKYDIRAPKESRVADLIRDAAAGRPILVAGSTTDDEQGVRGEWEESFVIRAWERTPRQQHAALLVLAPRHPERFGLIESFITEFAYERASDWAVAEKIGIPMRKKSDQQPQRNEYGLTPWTGPNNFVPGHKDRLEIVLLDTIGDLAAVYGVADIAFVGGSLVRRGGHNPLEPAQFGVPVVMGPSFENFRDIVTKLRAANAICVIEEVGALESTMLTLLNDRDHARALGERARRVFAEQGGATARTLEALHSLLSRTRNADRLADTGLHETAAGAGA